MPFNINFKYKKGIKSSFSHFFWLYSDEIFIIFTLLLFIMLAFSVIFGGIYLEKGTGIKKDTSNVIKTAIVVKKKNGLINKIIVNSYDSIEAYTKMGRKDILYIGEKDENGLGIPIRMNTKVENVDSFYIEK